MGGQKRKKPNTPEILLRMWKEDARHKTSLSKAKPCLWNQKKKLVLAQKPLQVVAPLSSKGHLGVKEERKEEEEEEEKEEG